MNDTDQLLLDGTEALKSTIEVIDIWMPYCNPVWQPYYKAARDDAEEVLLRLLAATKQR